MQIINFGPIENADIQLTNCSFFAGKNNVGKSVTAQLLYGIMKVFSPTLEEVSCHLPELVEGEFVKLMEEVVRKNKKTKSSPRKSSKKSKGKSKSRSRKPTRTISGVWKVSQKDLEQIEEMAKKRRNKIKKYINAELSSFCQGALKEKIESQINYVFSSSIYDYIRLGEENAKIHFDYEDSLYQCVFSLGIYRKSQSIRLETNVKVDDVFLNKYLKDMFKSPIKHLKGKNIRYTWETSGKLNVNFPFKGATEKVYNLPSETYTPWNTYYIPAGRAGLLEGYKVVSHAFYKAAPTASLRDSNPPSISGVVADYYSLLMSFEGRKGHYNKMAKEISAKALGGLLEMDSDEYPFSVMKYRLRTPDGDEAAIDITKASSMVKELAPILMVVAEKLKPHDVLIVEEPESHLQSKTQLELAEFFFNLAKEGVRILMTTHSELMLRQCFQLFDQKDLPISGNLFIFKTSS
jgi:energy-coupling factor transporter ATP-binding protein EcfA2